MSERDVPNLDDLDLPDIPDEDEVEEADAAEEAPDAVEASGEDAPAVGRFAAVAGIASAAAARIAPLLAPVGRVTAPVATRAAPVFELVRSRVPVPVLAGAGSALGVVVLVLLGSALFGGSGSAAAEVAAKPKPSPTRAPDFTLAPPAPKAEAHATAPPSGPSPTAVRPVWEERDGVLVSRGAPMPDPVHRLRRDLVRLFDDPRQSFTITTRFQVLLRSGPLAPYWGVLLGYQDEANHLNLHFVTDNYNEDRPFASLYLTQNGQGRRLGNPAALPFDFWGRDNHEFRVTVDATQIEAWMDGETMGTWPHPKVLQGTPKGLFVLGPSRMRFESFEIR